MKDVVVNDKKLRELFAKANRLGRMAVKVGVLSSKGGDAQVPGTDFTMVDLAAVHELGNEHIPERSFIRSTCINKENAIASMQGKLAKGVITDRLTEEKALGILGSFLQAEIKKTITEGEGIPPPLAPSTIAAKGSTRPLVDTGRLLGAIQYEVTDGDE